MINTLPKEAAEAVIDDLAMWLHTSEDDDDYDGPLEYHELKRLLRSAFGDGLRLAEQLFTAIRAEIEPYIQKREVAAKWQVHLDMEAEGYDSLLCQGDTENFYMRLDTWFRDHGMAPTDEEEPS